jgi:predicted DNA-binding transcriptional regulator AlpA
MGETRDWEEYMTVDEVARRIHYSRQSIYNMIHARVFAKGVHYVKPTPKKVLFIWPALKAWLERADDATEKPKAAGTPRYKMRP